VGLECARWQKPPALISGSEIKSSICGDGDFVGALEREIDVARRSSRSNFKIVLQLAVMTVKENINAFADIGVANA